MNVLGYILFNLIFVLFGWLLNPNSLSFLVTGIEKIMLCTSLVHTKFKTSIIKNRIQACQTIYPFGTKMGLSFSHALRLVLSAGLSPVLSDHRTVRVQADFSSGSLLNFP